MQVNVADLRAGFGLFMQVSVLVHFSQQLPTILALFEISMFVTLAIIM